MPRRKREDHEADKSREDPTTGREDDTTEAAEESPDEGNPSAVAGRVNPEA